MDISNISEFIESLRPKLGINETSFIDIKKPVICGIPYSDPQLVFVSDSSYELSVIRTSLNYKELIDNYIVSSNLDVDEFSKNLIAISLKDIVHNFPAIGYVLGKFIISANKSVPTMGVGLSEDSSGFYLFYNPKFVASYAIESALINSARFYRGIQIEDLVNTIKYILMHEAIHVVKSHQSVKNGIREVSFIENIVADSDVNCILNSLFGDNTPTSILTDGVGEGIFISINSTNSKIEEYLKLTEDSPKFNECAQFICRELINFLTAKTMKVNEFKYYFINIQSFLNTWTYDQVISGIEIFEKEVCVTPISQRLINLPDVIKDALLKNKSIINSTKEFIKNDIVKFLEGGKFYPGRFVNYEGNNIKLVHIIKNEIRVISKYLVSELINRVLSDGTLVKLVDGRIGSIVNTNKAKQIELTEYVFHSRDVSSIELVYQYEIDKIISEIQTIFVGDTVFVKKDGVVGEVFESDYLKNNYKVKVTFSGFTSEEECGAQELKSLKKSEDLKIGDYVVITSIDKTGKIIEKLEDEKDKFKIGLISDDLWKRLLNNGEYSDEEFLIETRDAYESELVLLDLNKSNGDDSNEGVSNSLQEEVNSVSDLAEKEGASSLAENSNLAEQEVESNKVAQEKKGKDLGRINEGSKLTTLDEISSSIVLDGNVVNEVLKIISTSNVEKVPWVTLITKLITIVSGIKIVENDQNLSRRIPGVFGTEEDIAYFKSVLVLFDTSGSMSIDKSKKSLKVITTLFDGGRFNKCIFWVGHYSKEVHSLSKLNRFSKERFMQRAKNGFQVSGSTADLSLQLEYIIKNVRPLPDFIINLTDGDFTVGSGSIKLLKIAKRMIFVIIGAPSYKDGVYKKLGGAWNTLKKNFILGAK